MDEGHPAIRGMPGPKAWAALSHLVGTWNLGSSIIALDTWHPRSYAEAGEAGGLEIKVRGRDMRSDALVSSALSERAKSHKDTCDYPGKF